MMMMMTEGISVFSIRLSHPVRGWLAGTQKSFAMMFIFVRGVGGEEGEYGNLYGPQVLTLGE
jgi:hypothetical protein